MTAKKKTAEAAYIAEHQKAQNLLERIGDLLQDQPAPGDDDYPINWGHVGNIEHVNTLLQEVVTFLASTQKTLPPWKR
jgi:hypothetical protein